MKAHSPSVYVRVDRSLALVASIVLAVGLFYIFAYVLVAPYPGLDFDVNWRVLGFDNPCEDRPDWCAMRDRSGLQIGDRLLVIGDLTYAEYRRRPDRIPFWSYGPGDRIALVVERDAVVRQITWEMLGVSGESRFTRLVGLLIFLPFWLAGTAVLLFLRPRNTLWYLLIAFNYLTAVWIASGIPSAYHIGGAVFVLRGSIWLMAPVYLHLHLIAPQPLLSPSRRVLIALYTAGGGIAVLQLLVAVPSQAHNAALLFALVGSMVLLLTRLARPKQAQAQPALRLMLVGAGLTFALAALLWIVPNLTTASAAGQLAINIMTLAISLLPFVYVYALYKRQLGAVEFRANRFLSFISFFLIYITTFLFVFVLGTRWVSFSSAALAFALTTSVIFVALGLVLRGPFQRLLDRIAYGTVHNPNDILRAFADEIPRALNHEALTKVLAQQVLPSLLVRQWALYRINEAGITLLHAEGATPPEETAAAVHTLLEQSGRYRPPDPGDRSAFGWVRLPIAVQVGGKTVAAWLLGGRDPDDFYPQPDVELLLTLAGEVGVALENARLFENLQNRAAELERAYAELQELDALKEEFIGRISHELRTPLTLIQGYTDLLLKGVLGKLSDVQREALTTVAGRSSDLIQLVNQIISVQEDSLTTLTPETVNLVSLAQSSLRAAEEQSKLRRPDTLYQFELQITGDIPSVWGDRRRLAEALDNLLDNAIKFSPAGGRIVVAIRPTRHPLGPDDRRSPQPAVQVSISDQGIGIPQDKIGQIWERFFQLDGSIHRNYGGLGLGLTIVRHTVEAHYGAVWAESTPGVGSTFYLVLPTPEAIKCMATSDPTLAQYFLS